MKCPRTLFVFASSVIFASVSHADMISVNFAYGNDAAAGANVGGAAGLTGNTVWNNYNGDLVAGTPEVTGTRTDALNNLGVATTADVSWTSHQTWSNGGGGSENRNLLDGYIDDNGALGVNVDVADIPYATYDVHVYFNHDGSNGTTALFDVTVNGNTFATTGAFTQPQLGIIDSGNSLTVSGLSGNLNLNGGQRATPGISNISGFEIVDTSMIPEPSSFVLLVFGSGLLLRRFRKK